jgi:alcohol dehydrogenase (cytochrome c)
MRRLAQFLMGAAFVTAGAWGAAVLAQPAASPFTAAQAEAGRAAYAANCAACHQANLAGSGEQPALAGPQFMAAWGRRTTKEFYDDIRAQMPYGRPGSLEPAVYQNITAFVLSANGAKPGTAAFDGSQAVRISSIANGQVPATIAQARRGGGDEVAGRAPTMRLGHILTGNIKNYTPVTDAMLGHPDPKDWLIYRGN